MAETSSTAAVLTGGCQCGAVRYVLHARPGGTHLCHCRMCQKAVGGPFAPLAPVRLEDFSWTRGTPATFRSSSVAVRSFCAACGTPLAFGYVGSEWIDVTIGSLDRPDEAPPRQHYGVEGRLRWFETIVTLPGEVTEHSMDPGLQRRLVNFQHPDHDTGPDCARRPRRDARGGLAASPARAPPHHPARHPARRSPDAVAAACVPPSAVPVRARRSVIHWAELGHFRHTITIMHATTSAYSGASVSSARTYLLI